MPRLVLCLGLCAVLAGCHSEGLERGQPPAVPDVHRPVAAACTTPRGPGATVTSSSFGAQCHTDAECTAGSNGRCTGDPHDGYRCTYDECQSDADCATGMLCDCRSTWLKGNTTNAPTRCLPTSCHVDADCGEGQYCSPSLDGSCGYYFGVTSWACHSAADACVNDRDCASFDAGFGFGAPYCVHQPETGAWGCDITQCAG